MANHHHQLIAIAITALFWTLTALGCAYGLIWGDRVGRIGVGLTICVSLISTVVETFYAPWAGHSFELLAVDSGYFISLVALAVWSRRYWPIWLAGFQLASLLALLAPLFLSGLSARLVISLEQFWAIPMQTVECIGIWLDRRALLGLTSSAARLD